MNDACQSSIKIGQRGPRLFGLLVGLILEAQEGMDVPDKDSVVAEAQIMCATGHSKNQHIGVQEKESEERRGHIQMQQPSSGESIWDLWKSYFPPSLSDKLIR